MLAKKVIETFKRIKVFKNGHVEKKGRFSYLSWTAAIEILNDEFPDNSISFDTFPNQGGETCINYYPDGTGQVSCTITIKDGDETFSKNMFLPILDNKNNPIKNPNAMAVNTAKQRCIVKCLAMMGLGLHVYKGAEDDPVYTPLEQEKKQHPRNDLNTAEQQDRATEPGELTKLGLIMGWQSMPSMSGYLAEVDGIVSGLEGTTVDHILTNVKQHFINVYKQAGGEFRHEWSKGQQDALNAIGNLEDCDDLIRICAGVDALVSD